VSWLRHELLADAGIAHGFGMRGAEPPERLLRPRQVHGARVIRLTEVSDAGDPAGGVLGEADAIVSAAAGRPVGVVTADCVPILIATPSGCVAAVHAGWRGLAAGVIGAAVEGLAELAPDAHAALAAIGPHVWRRASARRSTSPSKRRGRDTGSSISGSWCAASWSAPESRPSASVLWTMHAPPATGSVSTAFAATARARDACSTSRSPAGSLHGRERIDSRS